MNLGLQVLAAFAASYYAGILFRSSKAQLFLAGLLGAGGWAVYLFALSLSLSVFTSTFLASVFISALSVILSRIRKTPVTAFQVIAIFPIVPGIGMYNISYSVVTSDYPAAITYFFSTMQTAAAIALGILIVNAFNPAAITLRLNRLQHPKIDK
ncbi:threonine/serine exporter [Clostridiales bacterium COT073_COT-073]|nr:threonine/serine exporter [Clostridiales bacterium COT073_COT-073]